MLTVDGNVARFEGSRGKIVEFTASGRYTLRLGKRLPDGSLAWLDLPGGKITGENFLRALLTRHKLDAAVYAARYWKDRALRARWAGVGMGVLGAGIMYFLDRAKEGKK